MLNIIILEDQTEQAERLSQMLKKYAEAHEGFSYQLKLYDRSIPFLTEYKCDADILFMDIQVPDMLGIDAAKRVRQMDNRVMIIFITMLTQYAIEGYSVRSTMCSSPCATRNFPPRWTGRAGCWPTRTPP